MQAGRELQSVHGPCVHTSAPIAPHMSESMRCHELCRDNTCCWSCTSIRRTLNRRLLRLTNFEARCGHSPGPPSSATGLALLESCILTALYVHRFCFDTCHAGHTVPTLRAWSRLAQAQRPQ